MLAGVTDGAPEFRLTRFVQRVERGLDQGLAAPENQRVPARQYIANQIRTQPGK